MQTVKKSELVAGLSDPSDQAYLSTIEEILEEARQGRMFVLIDDEDRENEGDLVIPAQCATPETINFMARFGRGLICLAMTGERIEQLRLPLMSKQNASRHQTAFTVSIEAREGVTTGISAADRARTIQVAIDPALGADDIATPGHVFPLVARDGGVLVRAGHTEAAVDLARMAGMTPAGVICEIMNDDGSMARLPDLVKFAQFHGLKIGTIADLIAYRRRNERLVKLEAESQFVSQVGGEWLMRIYLDTVSHQDHMVLIKGNVNRQGPVMVRMHQVNIFTDVMFAADTPRTGELKRSMEMITEHGVGVLVLLRDTTPMGLANFVKAHLRGETHVSRLMDYGVGAQILADLGVHEMILLTNTSKVVVGLE